MHLLGTVGTPLIDGLTVHFVYYDPRAHQVAVTGEFTDWGRTGGTMPLTPLRHTGIFHNTLELEGSAQLEYKVVVDGQVISDPFCSHIVDNGMGGQNSYFVVGDLHSWGAYDCCGGGLVIGSRPIMSDQAPPAGISEEDWAATPQAVRMLVIELLRRLAQVEARLNQTSRNSSKPPSSDPPQARPRATKEPTGRKSGGQPGHEGHGRKLKPESEVDQIIDVRPESCGQCGTLLLGEDAEAERHQVTDVPRIAPVVTEYRRHCLWCVACGARTQAAWPATMPTGSFGPRVQATVGYLTGRIGASQREVQDILATLWQTDASVGGIGALEQAVSVALAAPIAEAQTYVQRQPVRNADETSWREKAQRRWLWISVTPLEFTPDALRARGPPRRGCPPPAPWRRC